MTMERRLLKELGRIFWVVSIYYSENLKITEMWRYAAYSIQKTRQFGDRHGDTVRSPLYEMLQNETLNNSVSNLLHSS